MKATRRELLISGAVLLVTGGSSAADNHPILKGRKMSALNQIRQLDYTIIFARDMPAMQTFYADVMAFPILRRLGDSWVEFGVGSNRLALTVYGAMFNDEPPQKGALSTQLAFRVAPPEVEKCAAELEHKGVKFVSPVTDQPWGHRTLFFRDPDGNILEIYADI